MVVLGGLLCVSARNVYRKVSKYSPVEASIRTEKLEVPADSPQMMRQAGSGCLAVFSSMMVMGLPGFFLSYSAAWLRAFSMAVFLGASGSALLAGVRNWGR